MLGQTADTLMARQDEALGFRITESIPETREKSRYFFRIMTLLQQECHPLPQIGQVSALG